MKQMTIGPAQVARWALGIGITVLVIVPPLVYYRWSYVHTRRLRVVEPGKFYRSGRMTGNGLEETIKKYKIRTVINLMEEEKEPQLDRSFFGGGTVGEKDICNKYGVRYMVLPLLLTPPKHLENHRPRTIDRFLQVMDNPDNYPVLMHCRAGLHRAGVMSAIYRMEYQDWTAAQAWHELRYLGFGEHNCYADNPYVSQYLFSYRPGLRCSPDHLQHEDETLTPLDALIRRAKFQQDP